MSQSPGEPWGSAIIAAQGGKPQPVGQPGAVDPTWSPDGKRLLLGEMWDWTSQRPTRIHVVDLRTGEASPVPGSQSLYSPRWSPDGRSIVALSAPATRLSVCDLATGRWRDLLAGDEILAYPNWTRDGKRIQLEKGGSIVRVRAADGHVELVTRLDGIALIAVPWAGWIGLAPDDSPIALRETGPPEVYALDVEWP
jgi:dipeptidyl aminopeptidase/acylaminoacyl peptidase